MERKNKKGRTSADVVPDKTRMELRDWFAGQVLNGITSKWAITDSDTLNKVARYSYEIADAMIKEREKSRDNKTEQ